MDWFSLIANGIAVLGVIFSILSLFSSSEQISRVLTFISSFLDRILPFLSKRFTITIVATIITTIFFTAFITLISTSLSSSNTPKKSPVPSTSQYSIYSSNSDVHGFTTKIAWDTSATTQHSMSISLDMQPSSNASDIRLLSQKFGSSYDFLIVAQLGIDSSTFTAEPKEQMQQPIDQGNLSFHWIATPLHTGEQAVNIVIRGIWVSQSDGNKQINYYLGSHTWHISVGDDATPVVIFGQINVSQVLSYLGSLVLSVAFLEFMRKYFEDRKRSKSQADQRSTESSQKSVQQTVP